MGNVRALLAGGVALGGATLLGAPQAAMISLMAYRMFSPQSENADKTLAIAHRIAKRLLASSGRSLTAVTVAETAAAVYLRLRAVHENVLRNRNPLLLPPPDEELP